jgi:hypothetical protein
VAAHIETTDYPLWVVIYKKSSGRQTLSYDEVLEEAICFGLIDTLTKSIDEERYAISLRPRRVGGHWTENNLKIAGRMIKAGQMTKYGQAALPTDYR